MKISGIPYVILEVANCHGGSRDYMLALLEEFRPFSGNFGIKFQPFSAPTIALPDYSWYRVYEQLYFDEPTWREFLTLAARTKEVWLDMFDEYSIRIYEQNADVVRGLKLQASVLENRRLLTALGAKDLSAKRLLVNVSGYERDAIRHIVDECAGRLKPGEMILQVGFQAYPTRFRDSGLAKIDSVAREFGFPVCFADHTDGTSDDALIVPLLAAAEGCGFLEKHIRHSSLETKYDHHSALTVSRMEQLNARLAELRETAESAFVAEGEREYLEKSLQRPVSGRRLRAGQIPSLDTDVEFRRFDASGMNVSEIKECMSRKQILAADKDILQPFTARDFRRATIATIVACRMKSSRLKNKALLRIGALSSIETCLRSCLAFADVNYTVLATSTEPEDGVLSEYTYSDRVLFRTGDPEDVMGRFLNVAEELDVDVVIRVTGDMPYVSAEICRHVLDAHFATGADYSAPVEAAVGTGVEVINVEAMRRVRSYIPNTRMSEYMTYYFTNNERLFKINRVALPAGLVRNYRLTLDYAEDLELFNRISGHLANEKLEQNLANIFGYLDKFPEIAGINMQMPLLYKTDAQLIAKLKRETTIEV